ncbi:adb655c4-0f7f-477f-9a39-e5dc9dcf995c [Thermothielavioides terrestris]|uniref:Autophagy-related protein 1 n=1 Tax=Thermothielavioides terrestris TaxID=2587410 RepID=A0A3S4CCJ2_9PEZI|nr:adb655c4-0f7f-477f-9a39-e5dc9dcf995c [Thermothielavioides terrestris]
MALLSIGGRGYQKTCPLPGVPYKCILPPGPKIKLKIPCFEIEIGLAGRRGPELQEFRERRDAFLASCCDLEALTLESTLATEIATKSHTARPPEWRAMYWFESRLGEGGCGTVHKVRRLTDWAVFAAKEVVGRRSNSGFRREIDILQRLRHHRIVEYVDCYPDTQENTILVMEYCQFGSLDQMLRATPGVLALRTTAEVLKQVAEGLLYLHGKGVTHRDLKPANILVRSQTPLSLVLSDFGLAKDEEIMETYCGTPQFLAPEMFEGVGYTKAIDIWALGVIGILLLEGQLPEMEKFGNSMYPNTLFEKAAQMYAKDPKNRLVILVRQMLAMHPEDRPPAEDCVRDTEYALRNWGPCQPTAAAQVPSIGSGPIDTQVQEDDSDRTLRPSELHTSEGQTLQPAKEEVAHDSGDNGHEQPAQDGESTDARSEPSSCATVTQRSVRKRNRESLSRSNSMDRTARKLLRTEDGQSEDGRAV